MAKTGIIRTGVGGWTFEPWRGVFYPDGLAHARELEYASRQLTTIEIHPKRFVTHDFRPEAGLSGRLYFAIYRWLRPVPA